MPFDEESEDLNEDKLKKSGIKNVSSQKSIFESLPKKKSSLEDFEKQVDRVQEKQSSYKSRAAELALQFKKASENKTLPKNKTIFSSEVERELLGKMAQLAIEINNDSSEQEGMGSLSWIMLLFKSLLSQRDRINTLEYEILQIKNNSESILKESQVIDKKKQSG